MGGEGESYIDSGLQSIIDFDAHSLNVSFRKRNIS